VLRLGHLCMGLVATPLVVVDLRSYHTDSAARAGVVQHTSDSRMDLKVKALVKVNATVQHRHPELVVVVDGRLGTPQQDWWHTEK